MHEIKKKIQHQMHRYSSNIKVPDHNVDPIIID